MISSRAADDFTTIRARLEELRRECAEAERKELIRPELTKRPSDRTSGSRSET